MCFIFSSFTVNCLLDNDYYLNIFFFLLSRETFKLKLYFSYSDSQKISIYSFEMSCKLYILLNLTLSMFVKSRIILKSMAQLYLTDFCHQSLLCQLLQFFLCFAVPPAVTVNQKLVTVNELETAELSCEVSGVPSPAVSWYKGSEGLPFSKRLLFKTPGKIQILSAQKSDAGIYTCRASNTEGFAEENINLRVRSKACLCYLPISKLSAVI